MLGVIQSKVICDGRQWCHELKSITHLCRAVRAVGGPGCGCNLSAPVLPLLMLLLPLL